MTREEAIKLLVNATYSDEWQGNEDLTTAHNMAIKALETLEEFEKAHIITGGRLNGRTYAYKCGLEDGKRKALEQEPCEDAVSRQALIERINNAEENFKADHMESIASDDGDPFVDGVLSGVFNIREMVAQAPSVTPTPNKGKWLNKNASGHHFYGKCSECGQEFCVDAWYTQNMKFCPNCGAEMR